MRRVIAAVAALWVLGVCSDLAQAQPVEAPQAWPNSLEAKWSKTTADELKSAAQAGIEWPSDLHQSATQFSSCVLNSRSAHMPE